MRSWPITWPARFQGWRGQPPGQRCEDLLQGCYGGGLLDDFGLSLARRPLCRRALGGAHRRRHPTSTLDKRGPAASRPAPRAPTGRTASRRPLPTGRTWPRAATRPAATTPWAMAARARARPGRQRQRGRRCRLEQQCLGRALCRHPDQQALNNDLSNMAASLIATTWDGNCAIQDSRAQGTTKEDLKRMIRDAWR